MDPVEEQVWLDEQESNIARYLASQGLAMKGRGEIEWCLGPVVSLWRVNCGGRSCWVISGDLPTDFLVDDGSNGARDAMREFCSRWLEASEEMRRGKQHPAIAIGSATDVGELKELGESLFNRASLLKRWIEDAATWSKGRS